jgi:thiamine-phosphate pyrophosphorylase
MSVVYAETSEMKSHPLGKIACQLRAAAACPSRLSPLVFMSDPKRVTDLPKQLASLPPGCAVIYRHFGEPRRLITAKILRRITISRGQQLLIGGGDVALAEKVKADGVHFRRDAALKGPMKLRQDQPHLIITMAGLKSGDYSAPLSFLDGLFISSIFPSQSPSAGPPIGIENLAKLSQNLKAPIFALGGVTPKTAPDLLKAHISGFAAIDGFRL